MDTQTTPPGAFTGRQRSRKTHWSVHFIDHFTKWLITIGGIGTILAVSTVCFFLVYVVIPLFQSSQVTETLTYAKPWKESSDTVIRMSMDEFQVLAYALTNDGQVHVFRADTGDALEERALVDGKTITSLSVMADDRSQVIGFSDGTVQIAVFGIAMKFLDPNELDESIQQTPVGERVPYKNGMLVRIPNGQFRFHYFKSDVREPIEVADNAAIRLLDHADRSSTIIFTALDAQGRLSMYSLRERKNMLTGEVSYRSRKSEIPYTPPEGRGIPDHIKITGLGDSVFVIWNDGFTQRYDTRDIANPQLAEEFDLVEEPNESITAIDFLIGQKTLITGDSMGRVNAWFRIRAVDQQTPDDLQMVLAHRLPSAGVPVTSLSPSQRGRVVAAGLANGNARFYHITSDQLLIEIPTDTGAPLSELYLSSREDGLLGLAGDETVRWNIDLKHPEVTLAAIFMPVWYEGYQKPEQVWQSSGGTDDFEPKYGLVPLIFGTLKATLYSMLFGVPLALLAAIYTCEFMQPRYKTIIKPAVELMASLPSVVLGFLAALVFATFVEYHIPSIIACLYTLPFFCILGACLWQLIPRHISLYLVPYRFLFILLVLPVNLLAAKFLGPLFESLLFSGNILAWLDHQVGGGTPGWILLLIPLMALLTVFFTITWLNPLLRQYSSQWPYVTHAWIELVKFFGGCVVTVGGAALAGILLNDLGFDPRGTVIGTYVQRNALIVGFVMGFAVIPIVYTIAEDALSSVPEHLRSASLGCGATQWQTAIYIIIPTGMSGLFSAIMIGLGRAVGETMIVLMAAGNTPVMDWNIFNGFRTLSANIAVELPEAVRNSSHYRMLFLAALTLFIITFLVNTIAEIVRLRFRKRAFEL